MPRNLRFSLLLALLLLMLSPRKAHAQAKRSLEDPEIHHIGLAFTYSPQRQLVAGSGNSFWLQGGGTELNLPLRYRFKAVIAVHGAATGATPGPGTPGAPLTLITAEAGPRFLLPHIPKVAHRQSGIFLESLLGVTHGLNSTFPGGTGVSSSATSFALELGGGVDLPLTRRLGLRVIQADYVRSTLPNGSANEQDGLRLASGLQIFFGK